MDGSTDVGRNIANYRKLKGLTQAELAKVAKMSEGYLAAIEEGRRKPKIKTLARIAKCLDLELELLL